MLAYTLTRTFEKNEVLDVFDSLIWTERYYGDSDIQIVVPATRELTNQLAPGTLVGMNDSAEVMIIQTHEVKEGTLTVKGISLLKWLNNRFIRKSTNPADRYWHINAWTAGHTLWGIIYYTCVVDGPTGLADAPRHLITNLGLQSFDSAGPVINVAVPYGPVYDAMYEIAVTHGVGMKIELTTPGPSYVLGFKSYRGVDRTMAQSTNPIVRFSPQLDSLANVEELKSYIGHANDLYVFAPSNPGGLAPNPGYATLSASASNFDLYASMVFAEDITTVPGSVDAAQMAAILAQRAKTELGARPYVVIVDGEVVPTTEFKYRTHYFLGDLVELEGNSGAIQPARITEYIRAQDSSGEKAYPTVSIIV